MEATVWPTESHSLSVHLYLQVFIVMSLAGGLWLLLHHWLSLRLLLDILLLSCVVEILLFGICNFVPFTCSNSS